MLSTLHANVFLSPCDNWAPGNRWANRGSEKSGKLSKFPMLVSAGPYDIQGSAAPLLLNSLIKSISHLTLLIALSLIRGWGTCLQGEQAYQLWFCYKGIWGTEDIFSAWIWEVLLGAVSQEGQDLRVAVIMKTAAGCHNNENSCSQTHFLSNNDPFAGNKSVNLWYGCYECCWFFLDLCLIFFFILKVS